MVRVIGGRARGLRLQVPEGNMVRPTSDRVRESLFNILSHRFDVEFDGLRVLDLFAGAGTLGIEALSRGADTACFVEKSQRVAKILEKNLVRVPGESQVIRMEAERFLKGKAQPFDLVFMDPPYGAESVSRILSLLNSETWLSDEALVCVEQASQSTIEDVEGLSLDFHRVYGASAVRVLSRT